jgi:hypothetical protein
MLSFARARLHGLGLSKADQKNGCGGKRQKIEENFIEKSLRHN